MSYVKRALQPDEQIRYVGKIHWVIYLPGLLMLALSIAVYLASLASQSLRDLWLIVAGLSFVVALLILLAAWFQSWTTEIAVTSKRIIYKRGFIRRRTIEMHMDKVESVDVAQSILGRLLNYGTITIRGVGVGIEPLPGIASPIEFRNHVTAV
jgi:uncharacterized membrane protein YdbT with pleckstrin-like domain